MAIFKDAAHMEEIFGKLCTDLIKETELGKKLEESGINVIFTVNEPDLMMYVDHNGPIIGEEAKNRKAIVNMKMSGDTVHKFWLKKVNIPKAIALRQIRTRGPITKVLKLLPLLKPGQEIYPSYCEKFNLPME